MRTLKTYNDGAGRECLVEESGRVYRVRYAWQGSWEELACTDRAQAEHLAAHYMATGARLLDAPAGAASAQEPREGVDGVVMAAECGGVRKPCGRPAAEANKGQI